MGSGASAAEGIMGRPAASLTGVGRNRARWLENLGIRRVGDLLEYFPRGYDAVGETIPIEQIHARVGASARVRGTVLEAAAQHIPRRRRLHITRVLISDGTGAVLAIWFNRPYLINQMKSGATVTLWGPVERRMGRVQLSNPEYRLHDDGAGGEDPHRHGPRGTGRGRGGTPGLSGRAPSAGAGGRRRTDAGNNGSRREVFAAEYAGEEPLLPRYRLTAGLTQGVMRNLVRQALASLADVDDVPDPVPGPLASKLGLPPRKWSLGAIHFPLSEDDARRARRRLAFEELFLLQTALALLRRTVTEDVAGYSHRPVPAHIESFYDSLPFDPTGAQHRVNEEILADLAAPRPMHRLVQGDVGSGKTLVAATALLAAVSAGSQGAMMAPTEILAEQHHAELGRLLEPVGITPELLVGSTPRDQRADILEGLADGIIPLVVGTHALLEPEVSFRRLGLVVTDEQHRFGVKQREKLQDKGVHPDVLVMTATPIPRTLALTLYGDLDVSIIDEMPPGRTPVATRWLPTARRAEAYGLLRRTIASGRQAYVVCPLIDESKESDLKAATDLHRRLQYHLRGTEVGLLHGRMPSADKHRVMDRFRRGECAVLVTTTVIEVGVDVPNATLMIVEDADRFGLAQLHQLRGRVGRGRHRGACVLLADPATPEGEERMKAMVDSSDGFVIAERDLELRGPGEFFGTRQHGLPDLKAANLVTDQDLLIRAQEEARRLIASDPDLDHPRHRELKRMLIHRYREQMGLALVG